VGFVTTFDRIDPGSIEPAPVHIESGSGTCSVDYATADDTAHAGVDYTAKSGTLSFGSSPQNINVSTMGPGESREFTVTLSNPVGCTIDPSATVMFVALVAS
jgi:chitinase